MSISEANNCIQGTINNTTRKPSCSHFLFAGKSTALRRTKQSNYLFQACFLKILPSMDPEAPHCRWIQPLSLPCQLKPLVRLFQTHSPERIGRFWCCGFQFKLYLILLIHSFICLLYDLLITYNQLLPLIITYQLICLFMNLIINLNLNLFIYFYLFIYLFI